MLGSHKISKRVRSVYYQAVGNLFSLGAGTGKKSSEEGEGFWDDLIAFCKQRDWERVLNLLDVQKEQGPRFDFVKAYNFVLQGCLEVKALEEGKRFHVHIRENGLDHVKKLNNILLLLYVRCCDLQAAQEVFDRVCQKDIDSWTLLIGGFVNAGLQEEACRLFWRMESEGVKPNGVTCVSILKVCAKVTHLMMLHSYIISLELHLNLYVRNTLLHMYFKCGCFEDAVSVFALLHAKSQISWNTLIAGHTQYGLLEKAFELYEDMKLKGAKPDEVTFLSIIKAGTHNITSLKRLHVEIRHSGLEPNIFVASALIDRYAVFGKTQYAHNVFEAVLLKDVPLWNSMLFCHAEHGDATETLSLYAKMEKDGIVPDKVTFLSLLKASANLTCLARGRNVHLHIVRGGFEKLDFVGSALVDMYVKCGSLEDARHIFDAMPWQDLVSWNAIIAGYSTLEPPTETFNLFQNMKRGGVKPDKVTFLTMLKACANLGALEQGQYTHTCVRDAGFHTEIFVASALIDMYGKCGSVRHSREVFDTMAIRDEFSWSAMIAGYAQHGQAEDVFENFSQMQRESIAMDDVTFVGVLTACSHAGLVKEGCEYFELMKNKLRIIPTSETCACMVDLLGKAGQIQEAVSFIKEVGIEPTSSIWMALLNACKLVGDLDLAEHASEKIRTLDPHCTSAFVLLSNAYVTAEYAS